MTTSRRYVLFAGVDTGLYGPLAGAFTPMGVDALHTPWNEMVFDLVYGARFEAVVCAYPVPGADFGRFLSAIRSQQSPCRNAGLVLVAAPGTVEDATLFIGRGVNRVLSTKSNHNVVLETVSELLNIAPRVPVHAAARVVVEVDRGPQDAFYQTENLSATGMLLRGWAHLQPGMAFDFELALPGHSDPIRGRATVSRVTDVTREKFNGFGARFEEFASGDHARLEDFLTARIH